MISYSQRIYNTMKSWHLRMPRLLHLRRSTGSRQGKKHDNTQTQESVGYSGGHGEGTESQEMAG